MVEVTSETNELDMASQIDSEAGHARKDGKRTKLATSHKGASVGDIQLIGGEWKFQKKPAFLAERSSLFDELYAIQTEKYA